MTIDRPMFPPRRENPFRLVGGVDVPPAVVIEHKPDTSYCINRDDLQSLIANHQRARIQYQRACAWIAAAEAGEIPGANVESALQDLALLHEEMNHAAHVLLVHQPDDPKTLVDLMMYLEKNFSVLPHDMCGRSLALYLLKSTRLALRKVSRYGKWRGSVCDE